MILPTKGIAPEQALLTVGATVLRLLDRPKTVSRLWDDVRHRNTASLVIRFDWFMLALDLLYALGAIDLSQGRLHRATAAEKEGAA